MELPFYARCAADRSDAVDKVESGRMLTAVFGWTDPKTQKFSAVIVCRNIEVFEAIESLYPRDVFKRGVDFPGGLPSLEVCWPFINLTDEARCGEVCGDIELALVAAGFEGAVAHRISRRQASPRA
jgi:hypothetical protein